MSQKISFIQLAKQIASISGCSQLTAETFLKTTFSLLAELLQDGIKVKIKGLGTFKRSENSNEVILYEPDKYLSEFVNIPFSSFEAVELDENVTNELFEKELHLDSSESSKELITEKIEETKYDKNISEKCDKLHSPKKIEIESDSIDEQEHSKLNDNMINVAVSKKDEYNLELKSSNNISDEEQDECVSEIIEKRNIGVDKNKVSLSLFITSVCIALILGGIVGYFIKDLTNNQLLLERINNQQEQLDSLQKSLKESKSDTLILADEKIENNSELKYDTVKTNRYITKMAQEYYGNTNFWVYIYEENKDQLGHPERIYPGIVVKIPPASKYGIDASDPTSIQKAKVKAVEIYAKFQK